MGRISLSEKRIENGVCITRLLVIEKNKYSAMYMKHKNNIDNGVKEYKLNDSVHGISNEDGKVPS